MSVGSAVVADPLGVLQSLARNVEEVKINLQAVQLSFMLSQEEREKAINIVLMELVLYPKVKRKIVRQGSKYYTAYTP